jgi:hypothetical protein
LTFSHNNPTGHSLRNGDEAWITEAASINDFGILKGFSKSSRDGRIYKCFWTLEGKYSLTQTIDHPYDLVNNPVPAFDLIAHLQRQREFSLATFGPGERRTAVLDHLSKEIEEVREAEPDEVLSEWVDLILLSLDGALRSGASPEAIAEALEAKQSINEKRTWPDWRTADPNKGIEHVRGD